MAAELADAASCSSDTTAPDPVPAALYVRLRPSPVYALCPSTPYVRLRPMFVYALIYAYIRLRPNLRPISVYALCPSSKQKEDVRRV